MLRRMLIQNEKAGRRREEGQTMAEYAVTLGIITVAVMAVFTALAGGISQSMTTVTGLV